MAASEPTTLLTNWVLATVALALGTRLIRAGRIATSRAAQMWAGAFLAGAAAALAGGIVHGFASSLPPLAHAMLWKIVLVGCGLACSLLLAGGTIAVLRGRLRLVLLVASAGQLVVQLLLVARSNDIRVAACNGAATIAVLLVLGVAGVRGHGSRLAWLALALGLSAAGIAAQRLRAQPRGPFNHNDVCHVLQTVALWPFYRVGLELRDRHGGPEESLSTG
jgi:hypothetical protein